MRSMRLVVVLFVLGALSCLGGYAADAPDKEKVADAANAGAQDKKAGEKKAEEKKVQENMKLLGDEYKFDKYRCSIRPIKGWPNSTGGFSSDTVSMWNVPGMDPAKTASGACVQLFINNDFDLKTQSEEKIEKQTDQKGDIKATWLEKKELEIDGMKAIKLVFAEPQGRYLKEPSVNTVVVVERIKLLGMDGKSYLVCGVQISYRVPQAWYASAKASIEAFIATFKAERTK